MQWEWRGEDVKDNPGGYSDKGVGGCSMVVSSFYCWVWGVMMGSFFIYRMDTYSFLRCRKRALVHL